MKWGYRMEIIHCCLKEAFEKEIENGTYGTSEIKAKGYIQFATWNSFRYLAPAYYKDTREYIFLVVDMDKVRDRMRFVKDHKGHAFPCVYGMIQHDEIKRCVSFIHDDKAWLNQKECVHILMNTSMIDENWCYPALKKYISAQDEVCVMAFSFFDDTKTLDDWNRQYKPGQGIWYKSNTDVFFRYGLKREQVHWVNYFTDSKIEMENKIMNSSIVFFTGGAPDLMMKRIREFKLTSLLKNYQGVMMGYSAGAMMQFDEYHITPDEDYPSFVYEKGLGCLKGFGIEPHYQASRIQKESMQRVIKEKQKDVYGIYEKGGIIIDQGNMTMFGKVDIMEAEDTKL